MTRALSLSHPPYLLLSPAPFTFPFFPFSPYSLFTIDLIPTHLIALNPHSLTPPFPISKHRRGQHLNKTVDCRWMRLHITRNLTLALNHRRTVDCSFSSFRFLPAVSADYSLVRFRTKNHLLGRFNQSTVALVRDSSCVKTMGSQAAAEVEWPANKVRDSFIKFFEERNHVYWKSSPVVPVNDPTLLFANAEHLSIWMLREDEFLGFLNGLEGRWGNSRKQRKYVEASRKGRCRLTGKYCSAYGLAFAMHLAYVRS